MLPDSPVGPTAAGKQRSGAWLGAPALVKCHRRSCRPAPWLNCMLVPDAGCASQSSWAAGGVHPAQAERPGHERRVCAGGVQDQPWCAKKRTGCAGGCRALQIVGCWLLCWVHRTPCTPRPPCALPTAALRRPGTGGPALGPARQRALPGRLGRPTAPCCLPQGVWPAAGAGPGAAALGQPTTWGGAVPGGHIWVMLGWQTGRATAHQSPRRLHAGRSSNTRAPSVPGTRS